MRYVIVSTCFFLFFKRNLSQLILNSVSPSKKREREVAPTRASVRAPRDTRLVALETGKPARCVSVVNRMKSVACQALLSLVGHVKKQDLGGWDQLRRNNMSIQNSNKCLNYLCF